MGVWGLGFFLKCSGLRDLGLGLKGFRVPGLGLIKRVKGSILFFVVGGGGVQGLRACWLFGVGASERVLGPTEVQFLWALRGRVKDLGSSRFSGLRPRALGL